MHPTSPIDPKTHNAASKGKHPEITTGNISETVSKVDDQTIPIPTTPSERKVILKRGRSISLTESPNATQVFDRAIYSNPTASTSWDLFVEIMNDHQKNLDIQEIQRRQESKQEIAINDSTVSLSPKIPERNSITVAGLKKSDEDKKSTKRTSREPVRSSRGRHIQPHPQNQPLPQNMNIDLTSIANTPIAIPISRRRNKSRGGDSNSTISKSPQSREASPHATVEGCKTIIKGGDGISSGENSPSRRESPKVGESPKKLHPCDSPHRDPSTFLLSKSFVTDHNKTFFPKIPQIEFLGMDFKEIDRPQLDKDIIKAITNDELLVDRERFVNSLKISKDANNFCSNVIWHAFIKDKISYNDYQRRAPQHATSTLWIIQNSGILTKRILPRLQFARQQLFKKNGQMVFLTFEVSKFSKKILHYLDRLLMTDKFNVYKEGITSGKSITGFLEIIDELYKKVKEEKDLHANEHKSILDTVAEMSKKGADDSKITQDLSGVLNIILMSIGGGSVNNGKSLIEALRKWAESGNGGCSTMYQSIKQHSDSLASMYNKVAIIELDKHVCLVEDAYREPEIPLSIQTVQSPHSPLQSPKLSAKQKHLQTSPGDRKPVEEVKPVNSRGIHSFHRSYGTRSYIHAYRSLYLDGRVLPSKITINNHVFYDENGDNKDKYNNRCFEFWFDLIKELYNNGFGSANDKEIAAQARLFMNLNDEDDEEKRKIITSNIMLDLPCLRIFEMMQICCRGTGGVHHLNWIYPKWFPESKIDRADKTNFPYTFAHPKGFVEDHIYIDSPKQFRVIQKNKYHLEYKHKPKPVGILNITLTHRPTLIQVKERSALVPGWESVMEKHFEPLDPRHIEKIVETYTDPKDISDRKDLPLGIHVYLKTD
jgi:hypothetical protein